MSRVKNLRKFVLLSFCFFVVIPCGITGAGEVNMDDVRALSKKQVKDILRDAPIKDIDQKSYWDIVHNSSKPVVIIFYSNLEKHSRHLATLLRYVAIDFSDKILFCGYQVTDKDKPDHVTAKKLNKFHDLDKTPGALFYDHHESGKKVLEHEHYEVPAFKEYRTPSMMLWKVYYSKVEKVITEKILD